MTQLLLVALALACLLEMSAAASISTDELKDAMEEAENVDDALSETHKMLKKWGGDHKSILKDVPAIKMTDNGIRLAGSADISTGSQTLVNAWRDDTRCTRARRRSHSTLQFCRRGNSDAPVEEKTN